MMYADALLFDFQQAEADRTTIASRMKLLNQPLHMLEIFHGYAVNIHQTAPAEGWRIIKDELDKGFPVGLNVDSYYVPWDDKYRKEHYYTHMIVVVGVDADDQLICLDPYFEMTDQLLPRQELELGFRACMTLREGKGRIPNRERLVATFRPLIARQQEQLVSAFEPLVHALDGIDFAEETKGCEDFGGSPLYHQLSSLIFSRFNFAKSLDYMAEQYGLEPLRDFADQCRHYSNKWSTVRALLAKMNYASQLPGAPDLTDNLKQRVRQLVASEADMLAQLLACLDGGGAAQLAGSREVSPERRQAEQTGKPAETVIPVDLASYCNNYGIAGPRANFDAVGFYYARVNMPDGGLLRIEDMSFRFPACEAGAPDNIACEGQTVTLPTEEVRGMMLLGSGEQGNHAEIAKLVFADGSSEEVAMDFPDWWSRMGHSRHVIAWQSWPEHDEKGRASHSVHLFAKKITFSEAKRVREIVLPLLPNLHLFALSLWK
ncbi:hypothetical protein XYCOK13_23400 [Xylanibacillus composti]|uniref:Butirosin biosynthesis protein H N-terminal domain-containing protein n=2 Tax=Xylanibacillus composti TaxID=1572762 RepID=A0A8J4M3H0_9BACL|nr:BtrH N-terminal domain-containing protein [Xylanibacillus composti]GIQ69516.1 hypothetical protein XYCOK13_23400 [Xylanibacillus composti]